MKRTTILLALAGLLFSAKSYSQKSFENGVWLTPRGNLRVLMVFVAIDWGDSTHYNNGLTHGNWPDPNVPPPWAKTLYDSTFQTPQVNESSKYFEELSFGEYHVTAGYHKDVIQLHLNEMVGPTGDTSKIWWKLALENKIRNMPLNSNGGYSINDFDLWTYGGGYNNWYTVKTPASNTKIDHLMIFVRNHPDLGMEGGSTSDAVMDAFGASCESISAFSANNTPFNISRHEYAHGIFGDNTYHSVGKPGGDWTFMWGGGGYGALSSNGGMKTLTGNAFDRHWVKYKPAANTYPISARSTTGTELNAQLDSFKLDPANPSGVYILRNFWDSGDAIRIKLPYTQRTGTGVIPYARGYMGSINGSPAWIQDTGYISIDVKVNNQYLWIENRQTTNSPYSLYNGADEGMYAYIQVGRDFTNTRALHPQVSGSFSHIPEPDRSDTIQVLMARQREPVGANYLHFLPSIGKYDYSYSAIPGSVDFRGSFSNTKANPFTGYTHLMQPAWDNNSDNKITKGEGFWVKELTQNGTTLPSTRFVDPIYGGSAGGVVGFDAFQPVPGKNKIGIGYNPSSAPVLTHAMTKSEMSAFHQQNRINDNKVIDLNNISVEILEQMPNGDIKVKVRFDDYDINQDVRWCGPLVLHDMAFVNAGATMTLDQGLMPTKSRNPITVNGTKVFGEKTSLLLVDNAKLQIQGQGTLTLKGESRLKVQDDAVLNLEPNSVMNITDNSSVSIEDGLMVVDDGAVLNIHSGCELTVYDAGNLQVRDGGKINVLPGAELIVRANTLNGGSFNVGESQSPGAPPDPTPATVFIEGKLIFQGIDWKNINKNGLFHFVQGSSVSIDPGHGVELTAPNNNTPVLKIDYTTLNLSVDSFRIEDALIDMNMGAKLKISNADFELEDVKQSGGSIEIDNPSRFEILRYNALNAEEAIIINNASASVGQVRIRDSEFNSCEKAVKASNVDHLRVYNTNITSYISSSIGIEAELCRVVQYHGKMEVTKIGALLAGVPGFYVAGSQTWIKAQGGTGILADNSEVFVRQGATIADGSMGIEIDGKYESGAYTSMFTMGDVGCGSLINNNWPVFGRSPKYFDGSGVVGVNTLVNVDAIFHAITKSTNAIQPNNVYGNIVDFDVCYSNLLVSPDTIFVRGNYYPLSDIPRNESHWPYGAPGTPGSTANDGICRYGDKWKWARLGSDVSGRSTCEPTNDLCHTCGERVLGNPTTYSALIIQNYHDTYGNFVDLDDEFGSNDNYASRSGFGGLASLELVKAIDTLEGNQWFVLVDDDYHPISSEAAHAVMVARVIYNGRVIPPNARMKPETPVDIFDPYVNQMNLRIVPNPARYSFRISVLGEQLYKYSLRIYRSTGELAMEVPNFVDFIEINTSEIGDMGIYFVEVISLESGERIVEKLIVEK